jgi:hypothetical protein
MRMAHYYAGMALITAPCLVLTLLTGAFADGSDRHLVLGFTTAILCVATNTLLILFMIVSGRVLKAAMRSRDLGQEFLARLNEFFARRGAYPLALLSAFAATAAAVLGYGRFIGVPPAVHMLVGLTAVLMNLGALGQGWRALHANQALLDRATAELDRLDSAGAPVHDSGEPTWAFGPAKRWCLFALSAWGPYLYWTLVVWRGDFGQVAPLFPALTLLVSLLALVQAWRTRARAHT